MHLPLVLALVLSAGFAAEETDTPAYSGTGPLAVAPATRPSVPIPKSCAGMITQAQWDPMPTWQKAWFQNAVHDKKWRELAGISDSLWERYIPAKKGMMILKALQQETDNRFDLALDRLYVRISHMEQDRKSGKALSIEDRQKFAKEAHDLETEYPGSKPAKGRESQLAAVKDWGARYDLEAEFLLSHKVDAALSDRLQKIRASGKAGAADLDALFDGTPPAAAQLSVPKAPALKAPPTAGVAGARSAAGPPAPKPRIRFEATPPTDAAKAALWHKAGGAAKEKEYYDKVMAGLVTPTEKAVLERLAVNQKLYDEKRLERLGRVEAEIAELEKELARLQKKKAAKDRIFAYETDLKTRRKERDRLSHTSPEVVVTFTGLDRAAGTAMWDTAPDAAGQYRLRMKYERDYVLDAAMRPRATLEYGMKTFTHEFSHNADMADPAGMLYDMTEKVAFLAGARAWVEEGEPDKYHEVKAEGERAKRLKADPPAWTAEHLSTYNYAKNLWRYLTPDDLADPDAGLRWRLKVAYTYATRLEHLSAHDAQSHAAATTANLKALDLEPELTEAIAKVYLDPSLPGHKKADAFVEQASKLKVSRDWVTRTKRTSAPEADRLQKAYRVYWKDLGAFYLGR